MQSGSTFNTMTSELKTQRDELVGANATLDERNRFTGAREPARVELCVHVRLGQAEVVEFQHARNGAIH